MNIPKTKKLPSGNWRIQLMVNGKRYSITDKDPKVCKQKAKEIYAGIEQEERSPLILKDAYERYIKANDGTLSPSTIRNYQVYARNYFQDLLYCHISDITNEQIQKAISKESKRGKSPKTIRNAYSLLCVVLKEFRPKFKPDVKLPQKKKTEISIPTEEGIQKLWKASRGTRYELPILLASWLGLRASEIRGLKFEDLQGNKLHIQRAVVKGPGGLTEKDPKTVSSNRWILCPEPIVKLIEAQPHKNEYIFGTMYIDVYGGFRKICERANITPCRFHDLRHFAASEAHSLGIPDKYQMQRMGHKTDNMLKTVYQHVMIDKEDFFANTIDSHMQQLYETV